MHRIVNWLEMTVRALPLPLLETWGRFAYLIGCVLALLAFGGFTLRVGTRWAFGRERQAWNSKAFASMPLTFVFILVTGYLGSAIVLVPGAQTFESLKDLTVFVCIVLFGYPALITVPFAYGLSDLVEGVSPDFLLDWLPGYFINPACFWVAYQLFGKSPDFQRRGTWFGYLAFVVTFQLIEPVLWGHICADKFTAQISYLTVTPALFFTTSITWLLAPVAMLGALPLARRLGFFWAEIDGHVVERSLGAGGLRWEAGRGSSEQHVDGVPIRMFLFTPFIALVLMMVAATAYVTLRSAEVQATDLARRLHAVTSENLKLRLDDYLRTAHPANDAELSSHLSSLLHGLELSEHARAFIIDQLGQSVAPLVDDDPIATLAIVQIYKQLGSLRALKGAVELRLDHVTDKPLDHTTWLARATAYRAANAEHSHWILITAIPESFYLAGVQVGTSRSAMVFAVALLLSLGAAALLASIMTAPLRRIVNASRALAQGDLSQRVPDSHLEELGAVARAFNHMAERVKDSIEALLCEVEVRKRREHELEDSERRVQVSENRLRLATSAGPLGVWDWDVEQDRLIWDDSMYSLYGLDKKDFSGAFEAWASCLAPEDMTRATGDVQAALRGEREFATEFCVHRPDGTQRFIRAVGQTIRDASGRALRMVGVNWDITERCLAEQELRKHRDELEDIVRRRTLALHAAKDQADAANRSKSVFLANMSHEIRTPMNVILGFGQLMERQSELSARDRDRLGRMMQSGRHLLELINSVLEMSKIEAGRTALHVENLDLGELLESLRSMFADLIRTKGNELELELDPELPRALEADAGKIRQVLINLLSNAAKFTSHGRIRVHAQGSERAGLCQILISVRDTGLGIEASELEHIFDAFSQTEAGGRYGGSGLGLTISRNFARLMRGDLTVESSSGSGSTFTFSFEAAAARGAIAAPDNRRISIRVPSEPAPRILVVDDEPVNRELMQDLLSQLNFQTRTTASAQEALDLHAAFAPDLILMDLRMSGMDGFEAIRRLRAAGSCARIIAFTASVAPEFEHDAREAGADDFLRKPYRERELLVKIASALELPYTLLAPEDAVAAARASSRPPSSLYSSLPAPLIAELREATIQARPDRIQQLSARAAQHSVLAAEQIRVLAQRYQYDALLSALEAPRE